MSIQRYTFRTRRDTDGIHAEAIEASNGKYVTYEDHLASILRAKNEWGTDQAFRMAEAKAKDAEIARLTAEVATLRQRCELNDRIAAWAASNGLLDETGEPRQILGTLPVTKDGFVVGPNANLYVQPGVYTTRVFEVSGAICGHDERFVIGAVDDWSGALFDVGECYSTREAAEAAAKERSDGQ